MPAVAQPWHSVPATSRARMEIHAPTARQPGSSTGLSSTCTNPSASSFATRCDLDQQASSTSPITPDANSGSKQDAWRACMPDAHSGGAKCRPYPQGPRLPLPEAGIARTDGRHSRIVTAPSFPFRPAPTRVRTGSLHTRLASFYFHHAVASSSSSSRKHATDSASRCVGDRVIGRASKQSNLHVAVSSLLDEPLYQLRLRFEGRKMQVGLAFVVCHVDALPTARKHTHQRKISCTCGTPWGVQSRSRVGAAAHTRTHTHTRQNVERQSSGHGAT